MAYNLLKGKRGIITGALDENSIAWKVAQRCHEEGATFTLTNAPIAMRMGEINALAEKCNAPVIGADATVARLGGDEFGVLLEGAGEAAALERAAELVAALETPFPVDGGALDVEASIGIAVFPDHGSTTEVLLQRADIAMYRAKSRQHAIECYAPEHDHHDRRHLALLADLRTAIGNGELVVHYMPQVNLMTGRVDTVEALVRWQHPTEGLLAPGQFVPLAERTGLIRPLTTHVLAQALRQIAEVAISLGAESTQIQGLMQMQEESASRKVKAVTEVARTMESLLDSAQHIAQSAHGVFDNAQRTRQTTEGMAGHVLSLTGHTNRIAELLEVIRDIADRSDLLALNGSAADLRSFDPV